MELARSMRAVDRRAAVVFTHGSVPRCLRCAAAPASSDPATRLSSSRQGQKKRLGPRLCDRSGRSATRQAARHGYGVQHIDTPVGRQLGQTSPALPSGEASSGQTGSGSDRHDGTHGELYLTWWDRLTRHCVLASTALLALSFSPLAASSAAGAGAAVQTLPAWTVRAARHRRHSNQCHKPQG